MFIDETKKEEFLQSIIFTLRTKAQKLKVDNGSIVAVGLNPCDEKTEEWLGSPGLMWSATSAREMYSIKQEYVRQMAEIPKAMLQAKKRVILSKKKEGAASFYRPMYRDAGEESLFLEVYTYVLCGNSDKAKIIATAVESILDEWLAQG